MRSARRWDDIKGVLAVVGAVATVVTVAGALDGDGDD
jgi:hypothetical protein